MPPNAAYLLTIACACVALAILTLLAVNCNRLGRRVAALERQVNPPTAEPVDEGDGFTPYKDWEP